MCIPWACVHTVYFTEREEIYFFFFLLDRLSLRLSFLRFWAAFCAGDAPLLAPFVSVTFSLTDFFFFSRRSFSSYSWFSRSINMMRVLQRRCNSAALRDFKNQSNRNCGEFLLKEKQSMKFWHFERETH